MHSGMIILTSTTNQSNNILKSGLNFDPDITLAIIIALIALISPIFVALINNISQAIQRKKEREHEIDKRKLELNTETEKQKTEYDYKMQIHKYDTYFRNQTLTYEQLLDAVGDYLGDIENLNKYPIALSSVYKARAYADVRLDGELDLLLTALKFTVKGKNQDEREDAYDKAFEQLCDVAKKMNITMRMNASLEVGNSSNRSDNV